MSDAAKSPNRLKISIVDLTFIIWALAIPLAFGPRSLNVDGDLPRHLTMGEFVLESGFDGVDTFAYSTTGPYEGMEWLSQVVLALAHRVGGLAAVVILAGLVIATSVALVVLFMRRRGVDPLLAYLIGTVAAVGASVHWVPRPHIFTFLFLTSLLFLLEFGSRRRVWLFVPFFALWANMHGMFILGYAILGIWSVGALVEAWRAEPAARPLWMSRFRYGLAALGLALIGTMFNPRGPFVFRGVTQCLGDDFIFQNTAEFQSLNFQSLYGRLVLVGLLVLLALFAIRRERPTFPRLFVVLFMLAGGMTSQRLMPLFALFALPLLAPEFDAVWRRVRIGQRLSNVRTIFEAGERIAKPGLYAPFVAVLLIGLAPMHGRVGGVQLVADRFDPTFFPVDAVSYARAQNIEGRLYNDFVWGGYLLYAWPEQRIFIDGMTCFLGSDIMRSYMKIHSLDPGWRDEMDRWGMTVALVRPGDRLAAALLEGGTWRKRYEDSVAMILERDLVPDVTASARNGLTLLTPVHDE